MYFRSLLFALVLVPFYSLNAQPSSNNWRTVSPGLRAIGISSSGSRLWICGVGEGVAVSTDGDHWAIKHQKPAGALLLGIDFVSERFGYAYGTGGTILTTEDGGETWATHKYGDNPILLASLADPNHGLFRTSESLFLLNGTEEPRTITNPADTLKRFPNTPFLVALTPEKMAALLSEGPYAEAGFLSTIDGGKNWTFYDPPSTGLASFLRVNGKYWATGHEVVNKDKPGGGGSVPLAMSSDDGEHWSHTTNDIRPCHWERCGLCTASGCLASGELLANFYGQQTVYSTIPTGKLTAKWASIPGSICSIDGDVYCAAQGKQPTDVTAQPASTQPSAQSLPRLGTPVSKGDLLRCLSCSVEPVYVDQKVQGQFKVHVSFTVSADGTINAVTIQHAPSPAIEQKINAAIEMWLFEPPLRDGKPIRVSTQTDLNVIVIRPK